MIKKIAFVGFVLGVLGCATVNEVVEETAKETVREAAKGTVKRKAKEVTSSSVQSGGSAAVLKVLPGNSLPLKDDFSSYTTGAVLPVINPKEYGVIANGREWSGATISETFDPTGRLEKALRIEVPCCDDRYLTTGSVDWTDYEVKLKFKGKTGNVKFRLFQDGSDSKALQIEVDDRGIRLIKKAGDQWITLINRNELSGTSRSLRDNNWHDLRFTLRSNGQIEFWIDGTSVLKWEDPDYHKGGFGIGGNYTTFFIDDLDIDKL